MLSQAARIAETGAWYVLPLGAPETGVVVLDCAEHILSLVAGESGDFPIRAQKRLTQNEVRVLAALLEYPEGCCYPVILGYLHCPAQEWRERRGEASRALAARMDHWQGVLLASGQEQLRKELKEIHEIILSLRKKLRAMRLLILPYDQTIGYVLHSTDRLPLRTPHGRGAS